ncbi:hypothetical protein NQ315_007659 [Exocentrus adspersus]|uniref:Cyclic nucleotide-binding domain-containing protein n=1 Tax=Exocentrus adspersus TaxID=1586481 RepID=A0AAV8W907_9CUCU|nr:hypothetical protein NQ315_007659 [Exocentrus adspersus]
MSKKVKKMPSLTPEEKERCRIRARMRFKAVVRLVIENLFWLQDVGDYKLTDNVMKNIQLLTRRKVKKCTLTLQERAILNKRKEDRTEEDNQILNRAIGGLKCFRRYPPAVKAQLAAVTYYCYIPPGRVIVKQGHKAHAMYFMLSGEAAVTVSRVDKVLNEVIVEDVGVIEPGTMFGEVALIHDICRLATLTTTMPCELLMIKKEDFDIVLKDTVMKAWEEIQRILNKFSYFKNWEDVIKRECSIMSRTKVYTPEEIVLGDGCGLPDYVYFITKGNCMIIEHLKLQVYYVNDVKKYRLYKPKRKEREVEAKNRSWQQEGEVLRPAKTGKSIMLQSAPSSRERKSKVQSLAEDVKTSSRRSSMSGSRKSTLRHSGDSRKERKSVKCKTDAQDLCDADQDDDNDLRSLSIHYANPVKARGSLSKMGLGMRMSATKDLIDSSKYLKSCTSFECFGDPSDVETHFVKVCDMIEGACFNIGENFVNRRVVAKVPTNCLLVPRYWLMKNNIDNIWNKVQQFLNKHIPGSEQIFQHFLEEQKFLKYRKQLIRDLLSQKRVANNNSIHNVPYSIRLKEGVDVDYGL